jgi:hypothetical protein
MQDAGCWMLDVGYRTRHGGAVRQRSRIRHPPARSNAEERWSRGFRPHTRLAHRSHRFTQIACPRKTRRHEGHEEFTKCPSTAPTRPMLDSRCKMLDLSRRSRRRSRPPRPPQSEPAGDSDSGRGRGSPAIGHSLTTGCRDGRRPSATTETQRTQSIYAERRFEPHPPKGTRG